jgi:hypothetical protein
MAEIRKMDDGDVRRIQGAAFRAFVRTGLDELPLSVIHEQASLVYGWPIPCEWVTRVIDSTDSLHLNTHYRTTKTGSVVRCGLYVSQKDNDDELNEQAAKLALRFGIGQRVRVTNLTDWSADSRNLNRTGEIVGLVGPAADFGDDLYEVAFDDERDTAETQASMDKESSLPLNHSTHYHTELEAI